MPRTPNVLGSRLGANVIAGGFVEEEPDLGGDHRLQARSVSGVRTMIAKTLGGTLDFARTRKECAYLYQTGEASEDGKRY